MNGSRKMCKNQFPITKLKLHWSNKNWFDENDCNKNSVFSWTYWDLARTNNLLYISYGETFMKESQLCTMYLNLNAQKN